MISYGTVNGKVYRERQRLCEPDGADGGRRGCGIVVDGLLFPDEEAACRRTGGKPGQLLAALGDGRALYRGHSVAWAADTSHPLGIFDS